MQKAFTLIELIIVMAIIAVLASGLLVGLNPIEQINRSKDTTTEARLREFASASERYLVGIEGNVIKFQNGGFFSECGSDGGLCYAIRGFTQSGGEGHGPVVPSDASISYDDLIKRLRDTAEIKDSTYKKLNEGTFGWGMGGLRFENRGGTIQLVSACYIPTSQQKLSKAFYNAAGVNTQDLGCGRINTTTKMYPTMNSEGSDGCYICVIGQSN